MTAWRIPIARQAETPNENTKEHGSPPARALPFTLSVAIKELFKEVKKVLTNAAPCPKLKQRRRRSDDDTRGLFKRLAKKILIPLVEAILDPNNFSWLTPPNELDDTQRFLKREWRDQDAVWRYENDQSFHYDHPNQLFPHL